LQNIRDLRANLGFGAERRKRKAFLTERDFRAFLQKKPLQLFAFAFQLSPYFLYLRPE
jgi:hypothetical protein